MCRGIVVFGFDSADFVDHLGFEPTTQITFGEVIKKYGNPDAYFITLLGIPESPQETLATLFFDRYNMTLNAKGQSGHTYFLDDTVLIENVGYGSADSYAASRRYSAPWKGFGKFDPTVLK
jgi:hypothetical protein